jgi:tRNA 5-methylaminomethyl-2-thiouridine biosynthesis bifunctional protein
LLEHRFSGKRELPIGDMWPQAGLDWSSDAQAAQKQLAGLHEETLALWHPMAGWIQTQCLVKAQLAHPQITIRFGVSVSKLVRHELSWQLLDSSGQPIAQAHHVVIANAHGCQDLLDSVEASEAMSNDQRPLIPITPLRGQVTFGDMNLLSPNLKEKLPPFPLNGHGSYIGNLPSLHSPIRLRIPDSMELGTNDRDVRGFPCNVIL